MRIDKNRLESRELGLAVLHQSLLHKYLGLLLYKMGASPLWDWHAIPGGKKNEDSLVPSLRGELLPSTGRNPKLTISLFTLSSLTGRDVLTPFPGLGTAAAPAQAGAHLKQCDLLKLSRRQKQLCRREPGLAETLRDAAHLGLLECQFQFRQERWNCSLEGRTGLLQRGGEDGRENLEGGGGQGKPARMEGERGLAGGCGR